MLTINDTYCIAKILEVCIHHMKSEDNFLPFSEGNLKSDRIEGEVSQTELIKFTAPGTPLYWPQAAVLMVF